MEQAEFGLKPFVRNRHIRFPSNRGAGHFAISRLALRFRMVLDAALNRVNS
jgi:hypothetical protein